MFEIGQEVRVVPMKITGKVEEIANGLVVIRLPCFPGIVEYNQTDLDDQEEPCLAAA